LTVSSGINTIKLVKISFVKCVLMTANAKIHQYQVLTFRYWYEQSVTRVSKEVTAQRKVYIGSEPNDFDINRNRYSENCL